MVTTRGRKPADKAPVQKAPANHAKREYAPSFSLNTLISVGHTAPAKKKRTTAKGKERAVSEGIRLAFDLFMDLPLDLFSEVRTSPH